jgi:protein-disulfide isomerase
MHDLIFQNQDRWSTEATNDPNEVLTALARSAGLNMGQYEACADTRKYAGQIQANVEEALRRQVQSTPTFFFGNTRVATALPYDAFKRYVDQALAETAGGAAGGTKAGAR